MRYDHAVGGDERIGPAHVALAADTTIDICALPAVPIQSWCDRAAMALGRIRPAAFTFAAVARMDGRGLVIPDIQGSSGSLLDSPFRGIRLRNEPQSWVGGVLGLPGRWDSPSVGRLTRLDPGRSWAGTRRGRAWLNAEHPDLLIGAVQIASLGNENRVLLIEMGMPGDRPSFTRGDEEVLRSAMVPLGRKAELAFRDQADEAPFLPLTVREQEILEQLTLGKSVKQIAGELQRSPHTVHDHVKSLHRKLNATSRGELVARALGHMSLLNDVSAVTTVMSTSAAEPPTAYASAMAG